MTRWGTDDIPNQSGRAAIVTGANGGLGYQTALALSGKGAHVVLACRNHERGSAAVERIRREVPGADVELVVLDLADLDSVKEFAATMLRRAGNIDLLINNAGIMGVPIRETTPQGFEVQLGTNHLGHFALTALLLPKLLTASDGRVVTVSSLYHRAVRGIDFDDLNRKKRYSPWSVYAEAKLANAMFVLELDRRLRAAGETLISVGAHPGFTHTNLQFSGPVRGRTSLVARGLQVATRVMAQADASGALPQLHAATAPGVRGGQHFGPSGPAQVRGAPKEVSFSRAAHNADAATRLWELSERMTGVDFRL